MDLSSIGKFIKTKRKERGLTQEQMAKELGISRYTLYKIEKGQLGEVSFVKIWSALRMLGYDLCVTRFNPFKNPKIDDVLCDEDDI